MTLDIAELAAYLSIAILIYYFLIELAKPKSDSQKWVTLVFIVALLAVAGYFLWTSYYTKSTSSEVPESPRDEINEESPEEVEAPIQMDYTSVSRDFTLTNKKRLQDNQITYEDFKFWYLSPDFLKQFTESTKISYQVKRKKLNEKKKSIMADLDVLKKGEKPKRGLAGVLRDLDRHDDSKTYEEAIEKMDALIQESHELEAGLNVEKTRKNLISALTDKDHGIDSLIGMNEIKDFLARKLYSFAHNPRIFSSSFQNIALYGKPGIGKTKAAQVIGHVYASSGILIRNHVQLATTSELTTAYVNESAKRTRKLLISNLESVVFIDEAYGMTPPPSLMGEGHDHGHEAVTELVNFTDKFPGFSIIIVAGYKKEMEERFMRSNKGLPSRFPITLELRPYNSRELTLILTKLLYKAQPGFHLTEAQANYLYTIIDCINTKYPEAFENQGRDMVNLSGDISQAMCGIPGKTWKDSAEEMILSGINSFLALKGHSIEEVE